VAPDLLVFAIALALDVALGEPPNAIHPVAWMGTLAKALLRLAPPRGKVAQFAFGAFVTLVVAGGFAVASVALLDVTSRWPIAQLVLAALILKPMFAIKALGRAALVVRDALASGDLARARYELRSLCSRDASHLDEPLVISATVESLAENASDSFVAPIFYYAVFGIPGVVAYRAVNTLDAMIGYRGRYEYLGKFAARLDDVLNVIPARLTAGLLVVAAWVSSAPGTDARRGWRVLRRDGAATESPNAGRPMAAIAGILGIRLEKPDHYRLGDPIARPAIATIDSAWRVVAVCAAFAAGGAALAIGARHA